MYEGAKITMQTKINTIGKDQRSVVRAKVLKEGKTVAKVARYIVESSQNDIDKMYTATKAVNLIITEAQQKPVLEWLSKPEDSLSEEELFKIPLNPDWKINFDYI